MSQVEKLTQRLVEFRTVRGNQSEIEDCIEFVRQEFSEEVFEVRRFEKENIPSLLISFQDSMNPEILLHGHIDVVEGDEELFKPETDQGKLYGRGTVDMKSGVACLIRVMQKLKDKKPDIGLLLTSDEEEGGFHGTGYLVEEKDLRPSFVISAEPDDSAGFPSIVTTQKGVLQLRISTEGKSAHGAKPEEGVNAAEKLMDKYREIRQLFDHSEDFGTTLNLGSFDAGDAVNKVPEKAEMELDIRYTDQYLKDQVIEDIRSFEDLEVEVIAEAPMLSADREGCYVQELREVAETVSGSFRFRKEKFASDMRFFTEKGIPAVCFGPEGYNLHGKNEFVELESLGEYVQILETFITSVVKG